MERFLVACHGPWGREDTERQRRASGPDLRTDRCRQQERSSGWDEKEEEEREEEGQPDPWSLGTQVIN